MGTCLDWHSSITPVLHRALQQTAQLSSSQPPTEAEASALALAWRSSFFSDIHARFATGAPQEDIDTTHRRLLKNLLASPEWEQYPSLTDEQVENCVRAWHTQLPWPDVPPALPTLRKNFDVVVLANGTLRLQVDITKSAGLSFDMLLSSELLGLTKPDPAIYRRALELLGREAGECVMVAAHAYDLRAARGVGLRTCYLRRWTEDVGEDFGEVEGEVDWFVDCREATGEGGGLGVLGEVFGVL